jgi:hypothetical protein
MGPDLDANADPDTPMDRIADISRRASRRERSSSRHARGSEVVEFAVGAMVQQVRSLAHCTVEHDDTGLESLAERI